MNEDSRAAMLARLRGSGGQRQPEEIAEALAALGTAPSALPLHEDRRVALLAGLLRNQASVDAASDRTAAVAALGVFLAARHGTRRLVAGPDQRLAALPWRDAGLLPRFGEVEAGDGAAVSYARLAVAESASVVLSSDRENPARNSLLPEDHIILLNGDDIVDDLDGLWPELQARLGQGCRPRGIQLISGPSSTADIALQMVFGAHGPRALHVILIDADAGDCLTAARSLAGERGA